MLKPCPFCGGTPRLVEEHRCNDMQFCADEDIYHVECDVCGARGGSVVLCNARYRKTCNEELENEKRKAYDNWNHRV